MGSTYEAAGTEDAALLAKLIEQHHPGLNRANLALVLVRSDTTPLPAKVRPTPPELRAVGAPDAVLIVDGERWDDLDEPGRLALLDHGLAEIAPSRNKSGDNLLDPAGRPKLKRRRPDLIFSGFRDVLERHGARSIEAQAARSLRESTRSLFD